MKKKHCFPREITKNSFVQRIPFKSIIVVVVQLLSCVWLFMTAWTAAHQASLSFTISWSLPKWSPLSWWCHPTISSSVVPFSSCLQFFPTSVSFPMSWLFSSGGQCIGASASASVLPMNIQGWFPLRLTGLISCCPRDSQESSPALQFKNINSSSFSFLYGPTLTSIPDYWKNHSFDYIDICQQNDISAFQYTV